MAIDISAVNSAQIMAAPQAASPAAAAAAQEALNLRRAEAAQEKPPVPTEAVLRELANVTAAFNRRLSFSMNEKLGQVVVKVIDNDTDTVIREIPPAEIQTVHERIREVIGILFDQRA